MVKLEVFVCLVAFLDKNLAVASTATPKRRGGSRIQNLVIILKTIRKSNLKSKINLKIAAVLKI
jgi:hypothetical protein